MITDSFDSETLEIISPRKKDNCPVFEAVIATFSYQIENFVVEKYDCLHVATLFSTSGETPIYQLNYEGKKIAFYRSFIGSPAAVATFEDLLGEINTDKIIMFGGAGSLDKNIARGKIIVPTEAYRDEGTSYHYAPAANYIPIKNWKIVAKFMAESNLPYVCGKTWTTDAFFRETRRNFEARKKEGCLAVEMEASAMQAVCDYRKVKFYNFLKSGDLLDAPEWDSRSEFGENGSQHDPRYFDIALKLAYYLCNTPA